jgi:predicted ester cyclase
VNAALEEVYHRYIATLNDRRFEDLDGFVHDRLIYNGEPWSREQYQSRLADDVHNIPDLRYDIQLLVSGTDHVAARLWFDCTPQREFLGIDSHGRQVSFAEHVFYNFRANRIEQVWSVIDTDAIRSQLRT